MSTISASTTSTTAFKVTSDTTGNLVLQTGSGPTTAVTIDTAQNLGLGVTPSANTLSKGFDLVNGAGMFGYSNNTYLSANAYYDSAWKYKATAAAAFLGVESGSFRFNIASSGTAGNSITFTEAMRLDSGGRLGIGVTSPSCLLDVETTSGSGRQEVLRVLAGPNATNNGASLTLGSTQTLCGYLSGLQTASNEGALVFGTQSSGAYAERARFSSGGRFSIGTTTSQYPLYINLASDTGDWFAYFANSNGTAPYGLVMKYTGASPNGTANSFYLASDTTTTRFEVRSNGGIANYSANNVNLSDRREKTNFAPAGDYLAKICAIPVQTFNYIDQNLEEDDGLTLGVVAQDVQAVAPELVMESNWAEKGEEPKMRLSIYQTDLQYALMKCIQEQQAIIETLTNRITALEAK